METISAQEFQKRYGTQAVASFSSQPSSPSQGASQPSLTDRLGAIGNNAAGRISQDLNGGSSFAEVPRRATDAVATAFSVVPKAAAELLPQPARQVLSAVGEKVGQGVSALTDFIGNNPALQKWTLDHPDAFKALQETLATTANTGEIAGNIAAIGQGADLAQKGADAISGIGKGLAAATDATASDVGASVSQSVDTLKSKVQSVLANNTVNPQLKESASRLFLDGTKNLADPVKTYDEFLSQSQRATQDIKADPAIATVGSEIGDAFKTVVQQRRDVGAVMGSELKKFAEAPVSTRGSFGSFQQELADNGATYDALDHTISAGAESKFTPQDLQILDHYAGALQKLGSNPTAAQVDAFISRIPNEIKGLKATAGIQFKTNAERLISSNLNGLRDALSGVATPEYNTARSAYSDLSNFINEGSGYLGKVTQSGDFTKDASLAKTSVQSILNNGKKDWLVQLEQLTGHPILDRAVLALQAMKDAGDFRGLSLLDTLSAGSIPLTKAGIASKLINFALQHGTNAIVGSQADQTRRFLKDLGASVTK